jgi:hypothetical protein
LEERWRNDFCCAELSRHEVLYLGILRSGIERRFRLAGD